MPSNTGTFEKWVIGDCRKCGAIDSWVIRMRSLRYLCEGCFSLTPELPKIGRIYQTGTEPLTFRKKAPK